MNLMSSEYSNTTESYTTLLTLNCEKTIILISYKTMLENIIIISLFVHWLYSSMEEWYLLHPVRKWLSKLLTKKDWTLYMIANTLFDCVVCMASCYSILLYPILNWYTLETLTQLFIVIPAVAATNKLLKAFIF